MKKVTEADMTPEQLARLAELKAKRRTPGARAEEESIREEFRDNPGLAGPMERGEVREEDVRVPAQGDQLAAVVSGLKRARESRSLTLRQVARRSGLNADVLSRLESGRNPNPTLDTLYRYAAAVGARLTLTARAPGSADDAPLSPEQKDILLLTSMLGPEEARRRLLALRPALDSACAACGFDQARDSGRTTVTDETR